MINYVDAVLLSGKYWCVADSCTLWHSILAERGLGCVKQLENSVAREARACFCNSSPTEARCAHQASVGRQGGRRGSHCGCQLALLEPHTLRIWKPHCHSLQGLCLETVFKQRETKKKRHLLLSTCKESSNHHLFLFVLEFNALLFIQQFSFQEFLFISEINYVVQHISLCILIHN